MLIVITLSVCGVAVLLLTFETAVPYLKGSVAEERDSEVLYGKGVRSVIVITKNDPSFIYRYVELLLCYNILQSFGVREEYFVLVCYKASSPNFFWKIFIFVYLGVLQIVGILLAFQTRKVKLPGLKDSKFIAAVVYISSVVLIILALVTFALRTHININAGIQVTGMFVMTTTILVLIFVPKV